MKIVFIHPLKHHVYYSMAGAIDTDAKIIGMFGYYYKNDILDKIIEKTKYKSFISGYRYHKIDHHVKTNLFIKFLFLLYKLNPHKFEKIYMSQYEKWVIRNLKEVDGIHVLQDYCNKVIRYAKKNKIKIIYEQIIAYDIEQYIGEKSDVASDQKLLCQKENFEMADYILMASKFVAASIESHFDQRYSKKFHMIPYGANVEMFQFHRRTRNVKEPLKLLTVANISKRKGSNYLIEAMKYFKSCEVQLTMIGVPDEDGKKMLAEAKKVDSISYLGRIPHSEISQYFNQNDIYVLPSLAEGSSLSVYEAIASGMPCIVTPNVGSVISDKKDGIIIQPKDTESIRDAVNTFIENPELLEAMSMETANTINTYTWEKYEKKMNEFYVSLIPHF